MAVEQLPPVYQMAMQFRQAILALDVGTIRTLAGVYGSLYQRLEAPILAAVQRAAMEQLSPNQARLLWERMHIRSSINAEMKAFAARATDIVTSAQGQAVAYSEDDVQRLVNAALPRTHTLEELKQIGLRWSAPTDALQNLVGRTVGDAPLANLFNLIGPDVRDRALAAMTSSLALGESPIKLARRLQREAGIGLTRSMAIARTETLRAYRESTRLQFEENPGIVKKWRRLSARQPRTCAACWALDGKIYDTSDPGDWHPMCRCTMVPVTVSWKELGLDVDDAPEILPPAQDAFDALSDEQKRTILGAKGFELYGSGEATLQDFVHVHDDPIWGKSATARTPKVD